jgi:hypothetical protein
MGGPDDHPSFCTDTNFSVAEFLTNRPPQTHAAACHFGRCGDDYASGKTLDLSHRFDDREIPDA